MRSAVTARFNTVHKLLMNMQMRLVPEAGSEKHLLNRVLSHFERGVSGAW